jgi:hypothetical protein
MAPSHSPTFEPNPSTSTTPLRCPLDFDPETSTKSARDTAHCLRGSTENVVQWKDIIHCLQNVPNAIRQGKTESLLSDERESREDWRVAYLWDGSSESGGEEEGESWDGEMHLGWFGFELAVML